MCCCGVEDRFARFADVLSSFLDIGIFMSVVRDWVSFGLEESILRGKPKTLLFRVTFLFDRELFIYIRRDYMA